MRDGLSDGSPLTYQGVTVGRITRIVRNASGVGVVVQSLIETQPPVPVNVTAEIKTTNLIGGGSSVALELAKDPKTLADQLPQFLPDNTPRPPIHATYVGLQLNLLPPLFGDTAVQITRAAHAIADTSERLNASGFIDHLNATVQNVNAQVTRAGEVIESVRSVVGEGKGRDDLKATLANIHQASADIARFSAGLPKLSDQASATITSTQGHVDDLSKQLGDRLTQMSALLDSVHRITDKIDKGQGTAGLLVNDPKLYQGLVDASRQLDVTLLDLQRLFEQWEQEGLGLKLK